MKTESGEIKSLSQLQLGDKVESVTANGALVFSEVIMFLDRNINETREFVQIKTAGGATIRTTPSHLLPVWKPHKHETKYLFANQVEENDFLLVNINSNLEPQRVTEVRATLSKGFIAPLTREGTIVVDSVAASCYALINSQFLAHISFAPYRTIKTISNMFSPASKELKKSGSKQVGLNWYANTLYSIKDYVLPKSYNYNIAR